VGYNYTNQGLCPLQKGDNHKNRVGSLKNLLLKNHEARKAKENIFKIFFSRTTWSEELNSHESFMTVQKQFC
jgi:hypothetical protein